MDAVARSRAPVRIVKATRARSRRANSVLAGITQMRCRICSRVGTRSSRRALATLVSFADRLKYSASEYEILDLYPGCPASQMKKRFRAFRVAYSVALLRRSLVRRLICSARLALN